MLGVDLNNASATQLFALNTKVLGSDNSEWQYVYATAALTTGQFVSIGASGTAIALTTAALGSAGTSGQTGALDIGVVQAPISSTLYGFVAKRGNALQIAVTGTCPIGLAAGYSFAGDALVTAGLAVASTAIGIFPYTSGAVANGGATAGRSIMLAVLVFPRASAGAGIPPM
jgi:hypothetical protein